jgi:hypothetical protein
MKTTEQHFTDILARFKKATKVGTDIEVAKMLGLTYKAFASRKLRNSFPEHNLRKFIEANPSLELDYTYIMTGIPSAFACVENIPSYLKEMSERLIKLSQEQKDVILYMIEQFEQANSNKQ